MPDEGYTSAHTGAAVDDVVTKFPSHHARHATDGADPVTPAEIGAAALDTNSKVSPAQASSHIVDVSASKTFALMDAGTFQRVTGSSSITLTIPANSSVAFPVGTEIEICRYGTGAVQIANALGVTIYSANNLKSIAMQYATIGLKQVETNVWLLSGSLA